MRRVVHGTNDIVLTLSLGRIGGRCRKLINLGESHDVGCECHAIIAEDLALLVLVVERALCSPILSQLVVVGSWLCVLLLLKDFS